MSHRNILDMVSLMLKIRKFESELLKLYGKGLVSGTTHTYIGQEATAVGVLSNVDKNRDMVVSNHRNHENQLPLKLLTMQIIGKNMHRTKNACDSTTTPRNSEAIGSTE